MSPARSDERIARNARSDLDRAARGTRLATDYPKAIEHLELRADPYVGIVTARVFIPTEGLERLTMKAGIPDGLAEFVAALRAEGSAIAERYHIKLVEATPIIYPIVQERFESGMYFRWELPPIAPR